VSVTGTAVEFSGLTEITDVTDVSIVGEDESAVTAVGVALPVTSQDEWEPYEGMLVTFPQDLYISEFFNFDRFGEIVMTTDRQYQGTHVAEPGAPANAVAEANDLARITLDDTRTSQNPDTVIHPNGEPFSVENSFRGGDVLQNMTGVVDYGFGSYKIQPVYLDQTDVDGPTVTYINANPRPLSPDDVGGDIKVASFNVLNFFTHLDDGVNDFCGPTGNLECRGADTAEEYRRQLDKLVAGIIALDADIVGIQEIENDILTSDGDRAHDAVLTLVEELNTAEGNEVWAWAGETNHYNDYPVRNEIIYRLGAVELVGGPVALADDAFDDTRPGDIEPLGRPPLAQKFRQTVKPGSKQPFTVVVNHFKSKGSSCASIGDPDTGDGQGNCNLTRVAQSEALLDFVDDLADDSSGVLVVGDLNSYAMEDPIRTLETNGLTDLVEEFVGPDAYSYVFDGQLGYLDTTFKSETQASFYEPLPYRVSDHDPVIVGLGFGGPRNR
jgi:predicted extracellular nuclease